MKKLLSGILCSAMLMGAICVPAYAVEVKSFSDVPVSRWSHDAIMEMVDLGMFKGKTNPDKNGVAMFDPQAPMLMAEFVAVMLRYAYPEEVAAAEEGQYWYSKYYDLAVEKGLFDGDLFPIEDMPYQIPRQGMAMVVVNTAKALGEDTTVDVKASEIRDIASTGDYQVPFILSAYGMGLITGYEGGHFGPHRSLTREEGAMVAYRLVNEDARVYPNTKEEEPEIVIPPNGPMTIYEGKQTPRPAKAGDTFVKADGTKVVLKIGPNGILGEGQGVAPDRNLKGYSAWWTGERINYSADKEGNWTDSLGNHLQNADYLINPYTGEGHWHQEWAALQKANPKPKTEGSYNKELSPDSFWYWHVMSNSWRRCADDSWTR